MLLKSQLIFLAMILIASAQASEIAVVVEVVVFSKADCGACVALKKTLNEMRIKYVEGIDRSITEYPVLVILVDNVEKKKFVGAVTRKQIEDSLK